MLAPLGWEKPIRWLIFLSGVLIFAPSIALVQLPLQKAVSFFIADFVGVEAYQRDIIFLSIPAVLLSGIVQETAKLIPILAYWLYRKRDLLPRFNLSIGALVGAGYGIFEAYWLLSEIFAAGFNFSWISAFGLIALAGFWERFFTVAFHTASGAVMGWGLARGKGWLFFILAVLWHFVLNYMVVLFQTGIISNAQAEFFIALIADAIFFLAFWLRWRTIHFTELETPQLLPEQPIASSEQITKTDGTAVSNAPDTTTTYTPSDSADPDKDKTLNPESEKQSGLPEKHEPDVPKQS